jgi:hypothetical protein
MFAAVAAFIAAGLVRVSPQIFAALKPLLISSSEDVWKVGYPLAIGIVKDLMDNGRLDGLDKHKEGVKQLKSAIIATAKVDVAKIKDMHLGLMILTAYANSIPQAL